MWKRCDTLRYSTRLYKLTVSSGICQNQGLLTLPRLNLLMPHIAYTGTASTAVIMPAEGALKTGTNKIFVQSLRKTRGYVTISTVVDQQQQQSIVEKTKPEQQQQAGEAMASNNDSGIVEATFPTISLVPKSETGVLNFLQKYPDYDGRDTVIAIFDSGVDPRASGLETICDGKTVKVIERYDCTGCGDVDVSKKSKLLKKVSSLDCRVLTPEMTASNTANGEYRIGLKTLHDLCPSKVRENIINYNKTKYWDGPNKTAIAGVTRKSLNLSRRIQVYLTKLPWDKKLLKEDLDYTLDMLNSYDKMYKEFKTSYDCILYQTSSGWRAVVDTTERFHLIV
ncbi:unnamed protein product [Ceratitis capitata]|uniref:(Mediterranean fruit fly) hypothetical protein n=1 Tax=Ceratitis capitata TaxID=7213 RepID=A0A811VE61_CERCA|nr:unnamed protein product [Ceratitis capitata]